VKAAFATKANDRFPQIDVVITSSTLVTELPGETKFIRSHSAHFWHVMLKPSVAMPDFDPERFFRHERYCYKGYQPICVRSM
jgi:hypothetical protein